MNTEKCAADKPSDYDSSWTSRSCTDSSCSDSDGSGTETDGTGSDAKTDDNSVPAIPAKKGLAQVESEQFDDIEELAQVEAESVYDDWSSCPSGIDIC